MEQKKTGLASLLSGAGSPGSVFPSLEDLFRPYEFYTAMRREHPVAHDERHGLWAVYRYEDVQRVLSDYATFSSNREALAQRMFPSAERPRFANSLVGVDPPRHRQLRDLVSRVFTPRAVAMLEPRIAEITEDLLDQVISSGRMDLIGDLSYPLPVIVIAEMLGIPGEDRARFKRWSDGLINVSAEGLDSETGMPKGSLELQAEMVEYFSRYMEDRRASPRDDLISGLVQAEIDGNRLSDDDTLAFCILLLIAGNVTTTNLLGNALNCLLDHQDQLARLREEPGLLPSAIEEVLRYESPVQGIMRFTTQDAEIGGQEIPAGQMVMAWIGSANRDEAIFPRAEQFDIQRQPNPHLSFGHGIHFCLGAPLARLESRVALSILLDRVPHIERVEGEPMETTKGFALHGPARLPLRFTPGPARRVPTHGMPEAA